MVRLLADRILCEQPWLTRTGIEKITADLKEQLVSIEGSAAPSAIVEAIQSTGRDAILRGSGKSNSTSAVVSCVSSPLRGTNTLECTAVLLNFSRLSAGRSMLMDDLQVLLYAY